MKLAYYITAHGYGHGTRSCDIVHALVHSAPAAHVVVKSDLPRAFLENRLPRERVEIRSGAFDVGLVQRDSITVDLEASLAAIEELYAREEELVRQEAGFIASEGINAVVADIPAIPLAAARRAGVPAIAVGNFGWDWIYADFAKTDPRWQRFVERFGAAYAATDLLLRLPFAEPMDGFPYRIDVPLLAEPGVSRREALAHATGADTGKTWVLLSFTSLNLGPAALQTISNAGERYEFFSVEPLRWPGSSVHCVERRTCGFADILASVDIVVGKPGFGLVSECIANGKPLVHANRENFREYPVLVKGIARYLKNAFIPAADLYAGRLADALRRIESAPEPRERMARGGARIAAAEILRHIGEPGKPEV